MMKLVIFAGLIAVAFAAPKEAGIEKAQFGWQWPQMGNGMSPWNSQPQYNNNNQYPIDYNQACSNQCQCAQVCVPWFPCGCQCPPPCPPPVTTTTTTTTTQRAPLCWNGLPDSFYPFCCQNGAENWDCELASVAPPTTTPSQCTPCNPCRPCMIWWMCQPCNCNNGCVTEPPTTTTIATTQPPPLCWNGLPDSFYPFCCSNGAENWACEIVSAPPPTTTPSPCVPPPCRCQPCMPWMPCQPCSCANPCQQG